jgi:hypothetical protein
MAPLAGPLPPVRCNGTVVMSDMDSECPGPGVARAAGCTREKEKGQAP